MNLDGLHPRLVLAVPKILDAMMCLGFPMMVTQGLRTTAQQQALYAQGRTAPGNIVTDCDGIVHMSNHQIKIDGFGHAVDLAFLVDNKPSWDLHLPWHAYGECAKALGLKWGGDFPASSHLVDLPHVEI